MTRTYLNGTKTGEIVHVDLDAEQVSEAHGCAPIELFTLIRKDPRNGAWLIPGEAFVRLPERECRVLKQPGSGALCRCEMAFHAADPTESKPFGA